MNKWPNEAHSSIKKKHNIITKCSTSLPIGEMKMNIPFRYLVTWARVTINKKSHNKCWQGCGERENLFNPDGSANYYRHYGNQYGGFSKNKKIKRALACIPAPPLSKNLVRSPREGKERCQRRMWVNKTEMSILRLYLQVTLCMCITLC